MNSQYSSGDERPLFPSARPVRPERYWIAHVDGGARGNPGPAGYGVVIGDESGNRVAALSEYLGHQTNNYAEYSGLLAALQYANQQGAKALRVVSDSELMVKQVRGEYKVRNPALQDLHRRVSDERAKLAWFQIEHVLRNKNAEADALANAAMDKAMGRAAVPASAPTPARREFSGVVRGGVIQLVDGELPDGTRVEVRIKQP